MNALDSITVVFALTKSVRVAIQYDKRTNQYNKRIKARGQSVNRLGKR